MSGFSNRLEDAPALSRSALREAIDRALVDAETMSPIRAWGAGERAVAPLSVVELLEASEYDAFERALAEHLESLG